MNNADELPFSDIASRHWAFSYIQSAHNNSWISGYPDGTFKPDRNITRAEAVTLVNNVLGWASGKAGAGVAFVDVVGGEWFYMEVMLAANGKRQVVSALNTKRPLWRLEERAFACQT